MTLQPFEQALEQAGLTVADAVGHALAMFNAFDSVGATSFDLITRNDDRTAPREWTDAGIAWLRSIVGQTLPRAAAALRHVIIRPRGSPALLIQLDDIDAATVDRLRPLAFLGICTSPDSFQAWLAVRDGDEDFRRRVKEGIHADSGASGSVRVSGSMNCKAAYGPSYPIVRNVYVQLGKIVERAELETLGLVAPDRAERTPQSPPCGSFGSGPPKRFPDYQKCLRGAKPREGAKGADISRVDYLWVCQAFEWGWHEADVIAELMRVSAIDRKDREGYVRRTVAAVLKRKGTTGGGS